MAYPSFELAELYFRRWDVELFFRHIKITLGMDVLRCKSPEMVRKEILMHCTSWPTTAPADSCTRPHETKGFRCAASVSREPRRIPSNRDMKNRLI